jgi:hypothetical protein
MNHVSEWNRGKTNERKESRKKWSQSMQEPISQGGYEVLFHEHLDGVGQNLKETKRAKPEN